MNVFSRTETAPLKRYKHNLSHQVLGTSNFGHLCPVLVLDVLPGDIVKVGSGGVTRMQSMTFPVMHQIDDSVHYWYVPYQALWEHADEFFARKLDPNGNPYAMPYWQVDPNDATSYSKLLNYMRIPQPNLTPGGTQSAVKERINALALSAYQYIYHERYRDQRLVPEFNYKLNDGDNTPNAELIKLRVRCYEHDYFTAASPDPQYGDPVSMPGGIVKLMQNWTTQPGDPYFVNSAGNPVLGTLSQGANGIAVTASGGGVTNPVAYDPEGTLEVDMPTMPEFRLAMQLQLIAEKIMRVGSRYQEFVPAFFGVSVKDNRLMMPVFVNGHKNPFVTSEVLQSADTPNGQVGDYKGHGVSVHLGDMDAFEVYQHGVIIGVKSTRPKTMYFQGIPKQYLKFDYDDYYLPEFAHIGVQPVQVRELFAYGANGDDIFGYQNSFQEHRFIPNGVVGDFQDVFLDFHLGRYFTTAPVLNQSFIECNPADNQRIFQVQTGDDPLYWSHTNMIEYISTVHKWGDPKFG